MQQLLDALKKAFPAYYEKVNTKFKAETAQWDQLFSTYSDPDIYRGLLYIVKAFLNGDKKQLFIQFPTDSLGRLDSDQKNNRKNIQEAFADFLFLASKDEWQPRLECPDIKNAKVGEFYYSGNRIWEIKKSGTDGKPRPSCIDYAIRNPEARDSFNTSRGTGIKLESKEVPPRKIKNWVERINLYRALPKFADFKRCTIVGAKQIWQSQPIDTRGAIYCPIKFVNDFEAIKEEQCDILVFLWDRKYMDYGREIPNLIVTGKAKKVIFLGSRIFDGFKDENDNLVYSFTFRELLSYYFGVNSFPDINFQMVSYPELADSIEKLSKLIPARLDDFDKKRVLRYALYPFLKMEQAVPDSDKFYKYLSENFVILSDDEIKRLVDWVQAAATNLIQTSPKKLVEKRIKSQKEKFYICPSESYKERLNSRLKNSNNKKNVYIIDALINSLCYVDIIKNLLEKGCLGTFYILSYFELPLLEKFFKDEIDIYNGAERSSLLGIKMDISSSDMVATGNLLDYYDASADDLSIIFSTSAPQNRFQTYRCDFADNNGSDIVDGDIICRSKPISIDELYSRKEDFLPCKITYYKSPSDFQHLMEIYFNFPAGQNVEYFASLWREKMRHLLKNKYNGNVEEMHKDFLFLKIDKLRTITRTTYRPNFPEEIGKIASELNRQGCITAEEVKLIRSANAVVGTHSSKAKELKSSLIQYTLYGGKTGFLKQLISNANSRNDNITIEDIVAEAMITRKLTNITLSSR